MKILIAKTAGFCMGVRRAVEMVLDAPGHHATPIFTYGPLIHNPQVLDLLAEKGIRALRDIPEKGAGTVLIRAHGVPPDARGRLEAAGFTVIDATCPRVIKVQRIIARHAGDGNAVIIIGDRDHPEVIGLLGYARDRGHVAGDMAALCALPAFHRAIIVAQTTQNTGFYEQVRQWAAAHHPEYRVFDTICDSTEKRQAEVQRLAGQVDALVVVGGKNSGNTQRLAEIGAAAGKPVFHVETEKELDDPAVSKTLAAARCVGITAGASTPNWIIRRVFRQVETAPPDIRGWGARRALFNLQRTLLLTNIYVALGAGSLCYACAMLQGIPRPGPYMLIAILYVMSMHILNHLTGREEDRYNDPDRCRFYEAYKLPLACMAVLSGAAGLLMAFAAGRLPFLILLAMSLMGLSYNMRIIPGFLAGGKVRRIRDLPGAKTVLIAMAWGVVTAVYPPLSTWGRLEPTGLLVFAAATGLVFARTAFFDTLDMQGDRIVGKGTIPLLLGEAATLRLLQRILLFITGALIIAPLAGLLPFLSLPLAACPAGLFIVLRAHENRRMPPGIRLEFLVESHFVLAGLLALLWRMTG